MMQKVKRRRRGHTRITVKNQITIPVEALRKAGLGPGDEVRIEGSTAGRVVIYRADDVISKYAGDLTGVYEPGYLERLRSEWR